MKKLAFLLAIVFCMAAVFSACGKNGDSTTSSTASSTTKVNGTTNTNKNQTTQTTVVPTPPAFDAEDIVLAEGQKLMTQLIFDVNASVDYKPQAYKMRVALIESKAALGGIMWYMDLLDAEGKIVTSTKRGGYGFIAVKEQAEGTNILIYNFGASENGSFNISCSVSMFSNYDKTGAAKDSISLNTVKSESVNGVATKLGVDGVNFAGFADSAYEMCDAHAWNIVLMRSKADVYLTIPAYNSMVHSNIKNDIKTLDGNTVIKLVEAYFGKIEN